MGVETVLALEVTLASTLLSDEEYGDPDDLDAVKKKEAKYSGR
jgi:hypothetical protein